jgi:hypothetical protein
MKERLYMKHVMAVICGLVLMHAFSGISSAFESDIKGSKDHSLIPRMMGFYISGYTSVELGSSKFIGSDKKARTVEGRKTYIEYKLKNDVSVPGELKIRRTVQDDLKKIGGNILFDDNFNRCTTIIVQKDGVETWVDVRAYDKMYRLTIIEKDITDHEPVASLERLPRNIDPAVFPGHAPLASDKMASIRPSVTYVYVGMNFDHQNPYNKSLTHLTIELTTPKPLTDNFFFPDVPEFQAQGYKLVISDGINTISSSDPGFSFASVAATNRIYSIDKNGLPNSWSLYCERLDNNRLIMSSTYAPGIYAHEGGDSTTKYTPSYGTAEYSAWTLGDSHVAIPVGPGSGKGTWSIK